MNSGSWTEFFFSRKCLPKWGLVVAVMIGAAGFEPPYAISQDANPALEKERQNAERFLQVLRRRPRPGTALDRVYGFHVQNGSLDEFVKELDVPEDADDAGQKQMILGLLQLQRGRPALAVDAFTKAEKLMSTDAACSYYLGRSLLAVGQTEKAADAMERAIERKPARNEALPIFTELGRIYGRAGQSEKALTVWQKLEALFPGDPKVGGQIARTFAEEGNVQEAFERYEKLAKTTRKDEDKVAFAVQAAEMQRRLGKNDEATTALETILNRLRPGSWLYTDVRNRIEDGFLKSGDYDSLAEYYKKKLADSEDNLALQIRLGRILVSAGRLDEAKETLEKAAERAPDDHDVRLALIDVLVSKADMQGAAKQYEALAEKDPENPDYLLRWGQILLEDEKQELLTRRAAAAKVWQRLADARGEDAVTLSQIADRLRSIDQKEEAIALYQKSIDVDPTSPQYREYLGEYLNQLDRKDEAIEVWKSIAEGDRRNRESLVRLAEVFGTFKQPDLSLKAWQDASEFDLTFAEELRFAKALRRAKKYDDALSRLDRAATITETTEEKEQLLKERIVTYQEAGTLSEKIAELQKAEASPENLRELAMMHSAAGQLTNAAEAITKAVKAKPDDVDILIVAADIAERQSRFSDAAEKFRHLAKVDTRFRTNYLQRVADLQMRLGQVDDAMNTCEEMIDANPASPDSYQFMARLAFRAGRDDQAFTALRRAMTVAPRDNAPRRMLASNFATRFRTDEAIELYWQAMRYESKSSDKISLIGSLAPLYDRKTDMDTLISRIEEIGRKDGDARGTQLMVAAAHEAVQDYGAARQAIDTLLAQQPRDVALLESMVRLCDKADEVVMAAEFQQRIVGLADTPENRYKLVQLQLDGGLINIEKALSARVSLAADPSRLGSMILSSVRRNDKDTAIAICREALRRDSSLWDVKLYLAELLLHDTSEKQAEVFAEVINHVDEIRALDVAPGATPPTKKSKSRTGSSRVYTSSASRYDIMRMYKLGQYASYSSNYSNRLAMPSSFAQAKTLAAMLKFAVLAKQKSGQELTDGIKKLQDGEFSLPPLDEVTDANVIREFRSLSSLANDLLRAASPSSANQVDGPKPVEITWRLAELDPAANTRSLMTMLARRADAARNEKELSKANKDQGLNSDPLSEKQIETLVDLYNKAKVQAKKNTSSSEITWWTYNTVLAYELELAGRPDQAKQYTLPPLSEKANLSDIIGAAGYLLKLKREDEAEALMDRLMAAARRDKGRSSTGNTTSGSLGGIKSANAKFLKKHELKLLDAVIARSAKRLSKSNGRRRSLSDGTMRIYRITPQGYYSGLQVKAPLSQDLFSQDMATELVSLLPKPEGPAHRDSTNITIPNRFLNHLAKPLPDAPAYENKARQTLAAYARWWDNKPELCYQTLIKLCEQYSDDVDLQIERARLASQLKQPRVALEALDSFDPLDSGMLVRKEMAAMNLAAELGDVDRAKQAAERLFGMRMDTNTQLALADQLGRLGMKDKAAAVLQRLRGGRTQSPSTDVEIANAFLAANDKSGAAEVAYTLLRRLNSGRSSSTSNVDYYRRRAVTILESAGKLDPLIERAKRRVASSPSSVRAKIELAELYTAARRTDDANKVWEDVAKTSPNDPRQLLAQAKNMYKAKKYKESMQAFLKAFEKDPQLFRNNFYEMRNAAQKAKSYDELYKGMLKIDPSSIPYYRIDELTRIERNGKMTDAKRDFLLHAFKNPQLRSNFYSVVSTLSKDDREKLPEIRDYMIDAVCADDAFLPSSSLWRVNSYSSNGTVHGPLVELVNLLTEDKEAAEKFRVAAKKVSETKKNLPMTKFLLALLDIHSKSKSDSESFLSILGEEAIAKNISTKKTDSDDDDKPNPNAVAVIRQLVRPAKKKKEESNNNSTHKLNGGLLWQAGQMLENVKGIPNRPALLVNLYKKVSEDPNVSRNSGLEYNVEYRLINVLVKNKQFAEAREILLKAFRSTDHSADNQYNPGYGEYQDLQAYQSIGKKLAESGCPIDALMVYHHAISDPTKFERAKRWGGGMNIDQLKRAIVGVKKKVNAEKCIAYLKYLSHDLTQEEDPTIPAISLLGLPLESMTPELTPGVQLAIATAATTDEGKAGLKTLASDLAELSEKHQDDWSISATQIMIAIELESDDVSELTEELFTRLPKTSAIASTKGKPSAEVHKPLLSLYTLAAVASKKEGDASKETAKRTIELLDTVATSLRSPQAQVAIASLSGSASDSLENYLALIEANHKSDEKLPSKEIDACLKIATTAAKNGNVLLSSRALKLALQSGPPLRKLDAGTNDAFAINRNRSSSNPDFDTKAEELATSLNSLIEMYSKATNCQLVPEKLAPERSRRTVLGAIANALKSMAESKPKDEKEKPKIDIEAVASIAETLQAIVMPDSSPGDMFTYGKPIASSRNYDNYGSSRQIHASSLSIAMARAAQAAGTSEQLIQAVEARYEKSSDKAVAAGVLIDVAYAAGNDIMLQEAVRKFAKALDSELPPESAPQTPTSTLNSISMQMQKDSFQKSLLINKVLMPLWPMVQSNDEVSPEVATEVNRLLTRTSRLINSDSYTASRHRTIAREIQKRMMRIAAKTGKQSDFDRLLQTEKERLEKEYANYSGDYPYMKNGLEQLMQELMAEGHVEQLPLLVREIIRETKRPDFASAGLGAFLLKVSTLSPEKQYLMLKRIALGDKDEDIVMHWSCFANYAIPHPIVAAQAPRVKDIQSIPLCDPYVPMFDTMLSLIDVAAKQGESENLLKELAARSKQRGDQADIAAGLVRLSIAKENSSAALKEIAETLATCRTDLKKRTPRKNDKTLVFPSLHWYLLVRAAAAGLPRPTLQPALTEFRQFANRGSYQRMGAVIARTRAAYNTGPAAGATIGSPLEHFFPQSISRRYSPDVPSFSPLYRFKDGWINGTGGDKYGMLMLRFPLEGSFTFSAEIGDGNGGSAEVTYGGVLFNTRGWNKKSQVSALGYDSHHVFPAESIKTGQMNIEAVRVKPDEIAGVCNEKEFVTIPSAKSYPWAGIVHGSERTTKLRDIKIVGDATIPRVVNLIDPMMRGWTSKGYYSGLPDPMIPFGPDEDADKVARVEKARDQYAEQLKKGLPKGRWSVKDNTLHFKSNDQTEESHGPFTENQPDVRHHIEYLRPLLDGDTIEFSVWWESGKYEAHPSIGKTMLQLDGEGATAHLIPSVNDLSMIDFVNGEEAKPKRFAAKNLLVEESWNTYKIVHKGDKIVFTINDKPLAEIAAHGTLRPGIVRNSKVDAKIQSILLTGDWPETVPDNLMELPK